MLTCYLGIKGMIKGHNATFSIQVHYQVECGLPRFGFEYEVCELAGDFSPAEPISALIGKPLSISLVIIMAPQPPLASITLCPIWTLITLLQTCTTHLHLQTFLSPKRLLSIHNALLGDRVNHASRRLSKPALPWRSRSQASA
jgi:hypothetical protein